MKFKLRDTLLKGGIQRWSRSTANDQGLTLLEILIAIIVVALTVSAITPAFVLAVATRVQSQKAEQAAQLAQDEVDKARVAMELGSVDDPDTEDVVEVDRGALLPVDLGDLAVDEVGAPNEFLDLEDDSCETVIQPGAGEACAVDIDGDDEPDFAVQAYRVNSFFAPDPDPDDDDNELAAFDLGVRVYAFDEASAALDEGGELNTTRASAGLTNRAGANEQSSYRSSPLAVVFTTIIRSEEANSLCDYLEYQGADIPDQLTCDVE